MNKVIELVTPKGEKILVNFKNVSHCLETNNGQVSLRINDAQGKDNLGIYLVVKETIEQIEAKLMGQIPKVLRKRI